MKRRATIVAQQTSTSQVFYTEDEPLSLNTYVQFVIITVMQISILCEVGFEV